MDPLAIGMAVLCFVVVIFALIRLTIWRYRNIQKDYPPPSPFAEIMEQRREAEARARAAANRARARREKNMGEAA